MPKPVSDLTLTFQTFRRFNKKDILHVSRYIGHFFFRTLAVVPHTMRNIQLLLSLGPKRPLRRPRGLCHTRNWVVVLVVTTERKKRRVSYETSQQFGTFGYRYIRRRHNTRTCVMYVLYVVLVVTTLQLYYCKCLLQQQCT